MNKKDLELKKQCLKEINDIIKKLEMTEVVIQYNKMLEDKQKMEKEIAIEESERIFIFKGKL